MNFFSKKLILIPVIASLLLVGTVAGVFAQDEEDTFYACISKLDTFYFVNVNEGPVDCGRFGDPVSWTSGGGGTPPGNFITHGEADSVTSAMIVDQTISSDDLGPDSVGPEELVDNSVETTSIASGAVTTDKMFSNASIGFFSGNVALSSSYTELVTTSLVNSDTASHLTTVDAQAQVNCAAACEVHYRLANGGSLEYKVSGNGFFVISVSGLTFLPAQSQSNYALEAKVVSGSAVAGTGSIRVVDIGQN